MVVGTSHVSPATPLSRSFYLLLIPAWGLLAASIYYGDSVHRRAIAALMVKEELVPTISRKINEDFICQMNLMMWGGGCLSIWLLCYLYWWILHRKHG